MFIKTTLEDSRKIRIIRNYVSKQNLLISGTKNADVRRTKSVCQVIYIVFGTSLGKV